MASVQLLKHLVKIESRFHSIEIDWEEMPLGTILALDAATTPFVRVGAPEVKSPSVPELWGASNSVDVDVSAELDQVPDAHLS